MNPEQLLDDLLRTSNISVLQGICIRLQVDYEALTGLTLNTKARALVEHLQENGRLSDLAHELITLQPQLAGKYDLATRRRNWIDDVAAGENPLEDTMITMQWQDTTSSDSEDPWIHERTTVVRRQGSEDVTTNLAIPENPYEPTRPTYQEEMFFGRENEHKRLWENLQQGQSMAIVGPSKIGKSSLLYMLTRPEHSTLPYVTAYLDLQVRAYSDLDEMLNAAFGQWIRQIGNADSVPFIRSMRDFRRWVKALNQKDLKPILCLDGIEGLFRTPLSLDEDDFEDWHDLAVEGQLTFLFASQQPLETMMAESEIDQPAFAALFQRLDLGLLTKTAVVDMLKNPLEEANLAPPAGLIEQLEALCGPHPYYLQLAGYELFQGLAVQSYSWANLRKTFIGQASPHWETLWDSLSVAQQETLRILCHPDAPTKPSPRSVRVLATKGLVRQEEDGIYRPFSLGFAEWLRKHFPLQPEDETAVSPADESELSTKERSWFDRLLGR